MSSRHITVAAITHGATAPAFPPAMERRCRGHLPPIAKTAGQPITPNPSHPRRRVSSHPRHGEQRKRGQTAPTFPQRRGCDDKVFTPRIAETAGQPIAPKPVTPRRRVSSHPRHGEQRKRGQTAPTFPQGRGCDDKVFTPRIGRDRRTADRPQTRHTREGGCPVILATESKENAAKQHPPVPRDGDAMTRSSLRASPRPPDNRSPQARHTREGGCPVIPPQRTKKTRPNGTHLSPGTGMR